MSLCRSYLPRPLCWLPPSDSHPTRRFTPVYATVRTSESTSGPTGRVARCRSASVPGRWRSHGRSCWCRLSFSSSQGPACGRRGVRDRASADAGKDPHQGTQRQLIVCVHQRTASENMKEGDAPWGVCLIILQNGISSFPCCSARISAKAVYMAANPQITPTTPPAISRPSMAP